MKLSHRQEIHQNQSLALTPQLVHAIRLLQLSYLELAAEVEAELERNPLLDRDDDTAEPVAPVNAEIPREEASDWSPDTPQIERDDLDADFGTSFDNVFPEDALPHAHEKAAADEGLMISSAASFSSSSISDSNESPDLEATLSARVSLVDHLAVQLDLLSTDSQTRLIGRFLIDAIDETGYLTENIADIAARLGIDEADVLEVLAVVQSLEPTGVGARDLGECLALQLRERDRFDPAMKVLVQHLDLVARHDLGGLRKLCGVDQADLEEMLAELRQLQPKPGHIFGVESSQALIPDVFVRRTYDGAYMVEFNNDTLPRVLLNRTYHIELMQNAQTEADRCFLTECLRNGDWLIRSMEQRAQTILKVTHEIVRQQESFLVHGAAHLRPLNLKTIADAIEMHESTISRVTANKAIGTDRGVFPMKYFFSPAVASADGGETHAAIAVRHRIRQMIDAETSANEVLSDDAIVKKLREEGIKIARRTVAKYRESLRIYSSVERRRAMEGKARHADEINTMKK